MAWEAIVIPPIIALAVYLAAVYLLAPLYRRRQLYSQYLPVALAPSDEPGLVSRARGRLQERFRTWVADRMMHRRGSSADATFSFGDEELWEDINHGQLQTVSGPETDVSSRRLSRDLEAGFRDDSDDEEVGADSQRRIRASVS